LAENLLKGLPLSLRIIEGVADIHDGSLVKRKHRSPDGRRGGARKAYVLVAVNTKIPYWQAATAGFSQAARQLAPWGRSRLG
jgi:hypothetical protein